MIVDIDKLKEKKPPKVEEQEELLRKHVAVSPFLKERKIESMAVSEAYRPMTQEEAQVLRTYKQQKHVKHPAQYSKLVFNPQNLKVKTDPLRKEKKEPHFLPLEIYDPFIDQEDIPALLKKYADPDGNLYGESRWFFPNGKSSFRKCQIMGYDTQEERLLIKWDLSGIEKKSSRLNVIFNGEDKAKFMHRIQESIKYRNMAENIIKYNSLIDHIQTPVPNLSKTRKERIAYFIEEYRNNVSFYRDVIQFLRKRPKEKYKIPEYLLTQRKVNLDIDTIFNSLNQKGYNMKLLKELFDEANQDFQRTFHTIEFEAKLPYSSTKII